MSVVPGMNPPCPSAAPYAPGCITVIGLIKAMMLFGRIGRPARAGKANLLFGIPAIDARLPDRGLAGGALHEMVGTGRTSNTVPPRHC
jgi:hypothetical protein